MLNLHPEEELLLGDGAFAFEDGRASVEKSRQVPSRRTRLARGCLMSDGNYVISFNAESAFGETASAFGWGNHIYKRKYLKFRGDIFFFSKEPLGMR